MPAKNTEKTTGQIEKQVNNQNFIAYTDPAEFRTAYANFNTAVQKIDAIPRGRSTAAISNRFQDIDGSTSVRDAFSRLDYEFFRPNEQMPKRFRDIIFACNGAYQKVALVRQIVDLMGDFCASGIELFHPNESIERFYKEWFKKINGPERSERLANLLYRIGNLVIKRNTAITNDEITQEWKRSVGDEHFHAEAAKTDLDMPEIHKLGEKEIPIRYTFLNPVILEVIGEEMAAFTGRVHYALKLPMNFYRSLNLPLTSFDPALLTEELPRDIQGAIDNHDRYLVLDPDKLVNCYYKKDDWDVWAYPMLYSILDDLVLFQKMKLADLTALDGVISHIRIWKLGSLEHGLVPTDAAVNKLAGILLNHMAGGAIDLIWGPDLEIQETSTDVYKFLGGEKYQAVMAHIHSGLGIPSALSGNGGSFSDNFLSLKTLIERLQYGRDILKAFWDNEIKLVQKAMGFRYPAQVTFANINLHDEQAEQALWIQLWDRALVSNKTLQERFGMATEIEDVRLKREEGKPKIGPYTDGEPELSMHKIYAQRGVVTPSETGTNLKEKKPGEKNAIQQQGKIQIDAVKARPEPTGPVGVAGQGRPKSKKDSTKRKPKVVKPRSTADETLEDQQDLTEEDSKRKIQYDKEKYARDFMHNAIGANQLQKAICDIVNPYYLQKFDKVNLRQLTMAEENEMEKFKFDLLFNCQISENPKQAVLAALSQPIVVYNHVEETYNKLIAKFTELKKDKLEMPEVGVSIYASAEELKQMRNYLYALFKGDYE